MEEKRPLPTIIILCVIWTAVSEASSPFLLFADAQSNTKGRILKSSPDSPGSVTYLPLSNISRPVALDYDVVEDRVYWTDAARHTISRSFLNGSMQEVIFYINVQTPDGLAVDSVGRNLYWTDAGTNKLEVSKLDGSYRKALITNGLDEPRDIILDSSNGIMYWTDWGSHAKIEKADMSGQQRIVLVNSSLLWPNGLTLDQEKNRLYWVDANYDKLEYLHLSSKLRVTLIDSSATLPHPFGLTLLGDYLYWTDWARQSVYRANKENGGYVTAFITGVYQPMDIHAYDFSNYTASGNSPCQINNGGCSHLCLLSSSGSACECPAYLTLKNDDKTCGFDHQKYLLFADAGYGKLFMDLFHSAMPVPVPRNFNMLHPVAFDVDLRDDRIYWTDVFLKTISRVFLTGLSPEVLVSVNVSSPEGLAVDPLGRNIYWTDDGLNKIEVSRLDGSMRKILIDQSLDRPRDIILDVYKGLMFWCDWGNKPKIEMANMDGSNRKVLVDRGLLWPNGLTLDHTNNWLYWVDAGYHVLAYHDLKRNTETILISHQLYLPHPFGLTLLEDYVYWTDWGKKSVLRTEKVSPRYLLTFTSGLSRPMDIHAYDKNQSFADHPCLFSNGGCSHLCLLRPDGYRCSCPDHLGQGEVCLISPIPLPFTSTLLSTASNSKYQTFSSRVSRVSRVSSSFIPFSSTKQWGTLFFSLWSPASTRLSPSGTSSPRLRSSSITASSTHVPSASSSRRFILSTQIQSSPRLTSPSLTALSTHGAPASSSRRFTFSTQIQSSPRLRSSSLTALSTHVAPTTSSYRFTSASQSETTIAITSEPPTTLASSECRPGDCKNGGTCVVPGYYCKCKKYYVWHSCTIYIGASAVEVELSLQRQSGPSDSALQTALAEACTKYFCKNGKCESKSKAGRVKRSEPRKYFKPTDIYILGTSLGAHNTRKIEFAVLFPSVDGQPPEVSAPDEIVQMVDESKGSIGEAVGATVKKATVVSKVRATEKPTEEPTQPRKEKSKGDQGPSIAPIAAGVGATVVALIAVLLACVIYRKRRKRNARNRRTAGDNIQLENDWAMKAPAFENPGFNESPIYDSISSAKGTAIQEKIKQANRDTKQELGFSDVQNKKPAGESGDAKYQSLFGSNPTYALPYHGNSSILVPEERYFSLSGDIKEAAYAGLQGNENVSHPLKDDDGYIISVEPQFKDSRKFPATTNNKVYENSKE